MKFRILKNDESLFKVQYRKYFIWLDVKKDTNSEWADQPKFETIIFDSCDEAEKFIIKQQKPQIEHWSVVKEIEKIGL